VSVVRYAAKQYLWRDALVYPWLGQRVPVSDHLKQATVIGEQRVTHGRQEYDLAYGLRAFARPSMGLCQVPSAAMSASASLGPQLPRR
jgi:hypothetical protein